MDYSKMTLGELLSSKNETIRRNATSILKEYQRSIGAILVKMVNAYCTNCSQHLKILDTQRFCPTCSGALVWEYIEE